MLQSLFLNSIILVAFISIGNQYIFGKYNLKESKALAIAFGVFTGILGCLLMLYGISITPSLIDLRSIAIIIASILGGSFSSIVASLIMGIFRISYFGLETSSLVAAITIVIMGLGCPFIISRISTLKKKWVYSTLFCTLLVSATFIYFIKDRVLFEVLLAYWISNLIVILIISNYTNRLIYINELYQKYKQESSIDFLTGLNNVRQFDKVFNNISKAAVERDEYLSLLFIDIDFFKRVNDTYGHAEGDVVLKELGNVLLKTCRSFDIVSRNGGEEFSVMLIDCPTDQAMHIAERIRAAVEAHEFILSNGLSITITISIGVSTYPNTTIDKLIEQADKALYEAKHTGRNRVGT